MRRQCCPNVANYFLLVVSCEVWCVLTVVQGKEAEMQQRKNDLEKQLEVAEVESATVKNDLKLAMKRIEDLQTAITGELDSESYSDPGSDSSDEDLAVSTRCVC